MKRYYFIFSKNNILLEQQPNGTFTIPCAEEVPIGIHPWTHVLNISPMDDGTEVKALMVDDPKSIEATDDQLRKDGWVFKSLRESFYHLPEPLYLKAGKCEELLYWDHNTQFCGVCGAPMKMSTDISKRCTQCGKEVWPQLATAVIVLIRKGDEVLLVHARNFASDFYGLVAGFVETGETLEEAVRREVMEETGLTVEPMRMSAIFERVNEGREGTGSHKMYFVFLCRYLEDVPQKEAVERDAYQTGMEWMTIEKAKKADLFPRVIRENLSSLIGYGETIYLGSERRGG